MKLFVCIKQVPDSRSVTAVNPDGTLNRAAMPAIVNPDDLTAMEIALLLKEKTEAEIIAISMGPENAKKALREVLAMGADRAYLISDREFGGSDTYATSQILSSAIKFLGFGNDDMIICGRQAIDGDTAQVGPEIAEKLGIRQVTSVMNICQSNSGYYEVKRKNDRGYTLVSTKPPLLITCVKEAVKPRYMSINGIEKSIKEDIEILNYEKLKVTGLIGKENIGFTGSPTKVFFSFTERKDCYCEYLNGNTKDAAEMLVKIIEERNII